MIVAIDSIVTKPIPATPQRHSRITTTAPTKARVINITLSPITPTSRTEWRWVHHTRVKHTDKIVASSPTKRRSSSVSAMSITGAMKSSPTARIRSRTLSYGGRSDSFEVGSTSPDLVGPFRTIPPVCEQPLVQDKENETCTGLLSPIKGSGKFHSSNFTREARQRGSRPARATSADEQQQAPSPRMPPPRTRDQESRSHAGKHRRSHAIIAAVTDVCSDNVFSSRPLTGSLTDIDDTFTLGPAFEPKKQDKRSESFSLVNGEVIIRKPKGAASIVHKNAHWIVGGAVQKCDGRSGRNSLEMPNNARYDAFKISGTVSLPTERVVQSSAEASRTLRASLASPTPTVPKIIITPPAMPPKQTDRLTDGRPQRIIQFDARNEAGDEEAVLEPKSHIQAIRVAEDQRGFTRFRTVVDAFLSDFFADHSKEYVFSMILRFVELVNAAMDPHGSCEFRSLGRAQRIPSLCGLTAVLDDVGVPVPLSPSWVRSRFQRQMGAAFDHIITGMIALVVE